MNRQFCRSARRTGLDGTFRKSSKSLNVRERYQCVVIDTAELRAWGSEWIACTLVDMQRGRPEGEGRRAELMARLETSEKMLNRGLMDHFGEYAEMFSPNLEGGRKQALDGVRKSMELFSHIERSWARGAPDLSEVKGAAKHHETEVGKGISIFLGELNSQVAHQESRVLDERARMIRETVDEIRDVNFRINLIAINASIEAARVGDAGRGFAHIAGEIRGLSLKSKDAFDKLLHRLRTDAKSRS